MAELFSAARHDRGGPARWELCLAHAGYVAEGVLYLAVGFFALLAAIAHEQPNGSKGAMARLGENPLGDVLLAALAAGLAAFVLWQLVLAFLDPEHPGERRNPRRLLVRAGHLLNGLFHCAFVVQAVLSLLAHVQANDETQSQVRWMARAFALPFGRYLCLLAGVGIVLFGLWQFYRAVTRDKNKRVDLSRARFRFLISALGTFGLLARGTLFCLVGGYLANAGWRHDPRYSGGVAGALRGLKQQSYGEWLLAIVAIGLLCYGLFQILKEPYRKLGAS